jgi:CreA protein
VNSHHSQTLAKLFVLLAAVLALPAIAEEIGCATTTWKLIGANHRVCIYAYDDPKIPGVTCHVSQARTGGIKGSFGLAEDPSQFSLACRQIGPITLPAKLAEDEIVFSNDTSIFFKETDVHRFFDQKRNVLIYMAISRKIIEGAPANSISTVPIQPWGSK